jgi:hypothetical protein
MTRIDRRAATSTKLSAGTEALWRNILYIPIGVNISALTLSLCACIYMLTHGIDALIATVVLLVTGVYFAYCNFGRPSTTPWAVANLVLGNVLPAAFGLSPYWLDSYASGSYCVVACIWTFCLVIGFVAVCVYTLGIAGIVLRNLLRSTLAA